MNWLEKMNDALRYIEENLAGRIDYAAAGRKAYCGAYQFQRVFSFVAGVPLAEYIRRRRMTLAAFDLQSSAAKVVDIALKYGYESPESFARAFQATHGVTPTMARQSGMKLKAYPRISFQISIKGDVEMDYRIEKRGAFVINGVKREFDMAEERCYKEIPEFWNSLCEAGEFNKMTGLTKVSCEAGKAYPVRACSYVPNAADTKFWYMIGVADENEAAVLEGYDKMEVAAGTWAVFKSEECRMRDMAATMQKLHSRIYSEWMPTSKYKERNYQQGVYYETADGKMFCEVWQMIEDARQISNCRREESGNAAQFCD